MRKLLILLACTACGSINGPVTIVVDPATKNMLIGDTLAPTIAIVDAGGDTLRNPRTVWTSSDPAVATVSSTGIVRAVAGGTATIAVRVGGVSGSGTVTVRVIPLSTGFWTGSGGGVELALTLAEALVVSGIGTVIVEGNVDVQGVPEFRTDTLSVIVTGRHAHPRIELNLDAGLAFDGEFTGDDRIDGVLTSPAGGVLGHPIDSIPLTILRQRR